MKILLLALLLSSQAYAFDPYDENENYLKREKLDIDRLIMEEMQEYQALQLQYQNQQLQKIARELKEQREQQDQIDFKYR